jgi:hypothetical protein
VRPEAYPIPLGWGGRTQFDIPFDRYGLYPAFEKAGISPDFVLKMEASVASKLTSGIKYQLIVFGIDLRELLL